MKRFFKIAVSTGMILALGALSVGAQQGGTDLKRDKCACCHGPDGTGKTAKGKKLKVKDVHVVATSMTPADAVKIVENGKGADMDAYGKQLTKAQIQSVVDYY